jgi:NhaP-type Na+/H+ or K+/H+ antiporter
MSTARHAPGREPERAHVGRSLVRSLVVLLALGILIGAAVGYVAVKIFDRAPLDAFSNVNSPVGAPARTGAP